MSSPTPIPLNQPVYLDFTTSSPSSGFVESAAASPSFWVFQDGSDTPIIGPSGCRLRVGYPGQYTLNFVANTGNGFQVGHFYNVMVSGNVENTQGQATIATLFVNTNYFDSLPTVTGIWGYTPRYALADSGDYAYYAEIQFFRNSLAGKDEYTVDWFRNTLPMGSGQVGSPTIQVIKRADGSNLIGQSGMQYVSTAIGTTRYDEYTNKINVGDAFIAVTTATIDGSTRTWQKLIGRDG